MTQKSSPTGRSPLLSRLLAALLVVNLAGIVVLAFGFRAMRTGVDDRIAKLEHATHLLRMERTSQYEGFGFNALLEHLTYWAPWLQKTSPGMSDFYDIQERVENIVATMALLPDADAQLEAAFRSGAATDDEASNDEIRKWLMLAVHSADAERGVTLFERVLRATDIDVGPRLRRFAARELLDIDKHRLGVVLHDVVTTETHTGVRRVPGERRGASRRQPFHDFIGFYVASEHPKLEPTLMRIIAKPVEHSTITLQTCIKALGEMKSRKAVDLIKGLYAQPSPSPGRVPNPLFRKICFIAVMDTLGADGVEFMKDVDRRESDPGIRAKLNEYKKKFPY